MAKKKTANTESTPTFDAPQSRNEAILQNMLGANNVLGEPQSRIEALLMQLLQQGGGGGGGGAVNSVNGQTGTVVLSAADVGAQTPFHTATLTIAVADWETGDPSFITTYFCGKEVNGMTNNALVFYELSDPDAEIGADNVLNGMVFGTDTLPAGDITVKVAWFV